MSPATSEPEKKTSQIAVEPAAAAKQPDRGNPPKESAPGSDSMRRVLGNANRESASGSDLKWKLVAYSHRQIRDAYTPSVPGAGERHVVFFGFTLKPYDQLIQPALVAELHLTDEQNTKLREIQKASSLDWLTFYREAKGLSPDEKKSAGSRWEGQQRKTLQKQFGKVLMPEQMQIFNRLTFLTTARERFFWPPTYQELALTKEQEDQVRLVRDEHRRREKQNMRETAAKAMAVLSPQQQARLRGEELGPLFGRFVLPYLNVEGQTKRVYLVSLDPYPDFSEEEVQKELGLSAAQQQQVQELLVLAQI